MLSASNANLISHTQISNPLLGIFTTERELVRV
jgi:hypothetical protein